MLATHLPFLLGPTLLEFRIEPIVQTAALVAIGYLFSETAHTSLTHQLINEMARETFFDADSSAERYAYVLATGFAIGLINLGTHYLVHAFIHFLCRRIKNISSRIMRFAG